MIPYYCAAVPILYRSHRTVPKSSTSIFSMSSFRTRPVLLRATKPRLSGISPFIVRLDTLPGRPVSKYDYWFWKRARPPFQRLPVTNSSEDYTELRRIFIKALCKKSACHQTRFAMTWQQLQNRALFISTITRAKTYVPVQFSRCDRWPSSGDC